MYYSYNHHYGAPRYQTEQFVSPAPWRSWPSWSASTTLLDRLRYLSKTTKLPSTDNKIAAVEHLTMDINNLDDIATTIRETYNAQKNLIYTAYTEPAANQLVTPNNPTIRVRTSNPSGHIAPSSTGFPPSSSSSSSASIAYGQGPAPQNIDANVNQIRRVPYTQALANASAAYEALLYTRIIAESCPNPQSETRRNKNTALNIIETEVTNEWEKTIATSNTLYETACSQHSNITLYKWVSALFDSYDNAMDIADKPSYTPNTPLPPTRPHAASKTITQTTYLEKLLKIMLLRHCPQRIQSDIERATDRLSDSWTWNTITRDMYFSRAVQPLNATAKETRSTQLENGDKPETHATNRIAEHVTLLTDAVKDLADLYCQQHKRDNDRSNNGHKRLRLC